MLALNAKVTNTMVDYNYLLRTSQLAAPQIWCSRRGKAVKRRKPPLEFRRRERPAGRDPALEVVQLASA